MAEESTTRKSIIFAHTQSKTKRPKAPTKIIYWGYIEDNLLCIESDIESSVTITFKDEFESIIYNENVYITPTQNAILPLPYGYNDLIIEIDYNDKVYHTSVTI